MTIQSASSGLMFPPPAERIKVIIYRGEAEVKQSLCIQVVLRVELQYILDRGGEEKEARLESRNLL